MCHMLVCVSGLVCQSGLSDDMRVGLMFCAFCLSDVFCLSNYMVDDFLNNSVSLSVIRLPCVLLTLLVYLTLT